MARFLVIEDDNTMRGLIVTTLENAGHNVAAAASGLDGAALFRAQPADVVITDVLMPGDSIEMVIALRNEHPELPFIVVSGLAAKSPRSLEIEQLLGPRRVLPKPFNLSELLVTADEVLKAADIGPHSTLRVPPRS